jgi:hypothetical protein
VLPWVSPQSLLLELPLELLLLLPELLWSGRVE